jgi:hypothetical protein
VITGCTNGLSLTLLVEPLQLHSRACPALASSISEFASSRISSTIA